METIVYSDLSIFGSTILASSLSEFPTTPHIGQIVLYNGRPHIYAKVDSGHETWMPMSVRQCAFTHTQSSPAATWTIQHNLNVNDYGIFVYDSNHTVIETAEYASLDSNTVQVSLPYSMTGTAVLFAVDNFSAGTLAATSQVGLGDNITMVNLNGNLVVRDSNTGQDININDIYARLKALEDGTGTTTIPYSSIRNAPNTLAGLGVSDEVHNSVAGYVTQVIAPMQSVSDLQQMQLNKQSQDIQNHTNALYDAANAMAAQKQQLLDQQAAFEAERANTAQHFDLNAEQVKFLSDAQHAANFQLGNISDQLSAANGQLAQASARLATMETEALAKAAADFNRDAAIEAAKNRLNLQEDHLSSTTNEIGALNGSLNEVNNRLTTGVSDLQQSVGTILSWQQTQDDRILALENGLNGSSSTPLNISINGTSLWAMALTARDGRGTASTPNLSNPGVVYDLKDNSIEGLSDGGSYFGEMTYRPWGTGTNWSTNIAHQMGFTDNGNIWQRSGTGNSWGPWKRLVTTSSIAELAPTLNGGGALGTWGISITGNAGTATKLVAARNIAIAGDATWSVSFDGSTDVSANLTLANSGVTAGTYPKVTVDAKGRVTSGTTLLASDIPSLDWSKITTGKPTTLSGYGITDAVNISAVGAAGGVASLDGSGKVPTSQLPSYVDDVLEYTSLGAFPNPGVAGTIYVAQDTNKIYRWGSSSYIEISPTAGNADSATKLATARTISLTSDVTGSALFDGSTNATISATLANSGVAAGTYSKVTVDAKGRVTSGGYLGVGDLPDLTSAYLPLAGGTMSGQIVLSVGASGGVRWPNDAWGGSGDSASITLESPSNNENTRMTFRMTNDAADLFSFIAPSNDGMLMNGYVVLHAGNYNNYSPTLTGTGASGTWGINVTGNAATATSLQTARSISLTSDVTGSASFDGSANATISATLANSGVTAGTYKSVTVDAKGRVTSGSNPTTLAGYGITDAQPLDADLTAIGALAGTSGLLKKTAANTWSLDTNTYITGNQTITVSGDATGSGTTSIPLTLANSGVTAGTYTKVTVDAKGRVTSGTTLVASDIPALNYVSSSGGTMTSSLGFSTTNIGVSWAANTDSASIQFESTGDGSSGGRALSNLLFAVTDNGDEGFKFTSAAAEILFMNTNQFQYKGQDVLHSGNYNSYSPTLTGTGASGTWGISVTGNAATATKLATARTISATGDATWSVSFDGSANATAAITLANSGVTAGTYKSVTVDAKGRVTSGSNPTTLAGYGITDAQSALGFTPVQQGGGTGQGTNKVYIGWASSNLNLQVDTTNFGASWPISVTGSAASATNATTASSLTGFTNTNNTNVTDTVASNTIGYVSGISLLGQVDGALYSQFYSASWQHEIFGDYRTGQLAVRGKNNGTWQAWRTILDSSNYNSYAPTLTGTGASGTWGISISGNAATASNATTAGGLAIHAARNNEANKIVRTDGSGYLQVGYINSSSGNENNASSPPRVWGTNGSDDYMRTYQTASLSVGSATNATNATYLSSTQQTSVITGVSTSMSMSQDGGATKGSFVIRAAGTGDANLAGVTYWNDAYAVKMGIRADGYFGLGGWSRAAWSWYSDPSGNMVAAGNVTAYSDPRLKENFERVQDPIGVLQQLDGGTFTWKSGYKHTEVKAGKKDYGVLADQVETVMPEIVNKSIEIDGETYKTVDYSKIVPVLIEAVKLLSNKIEGLEQTIAELKSKE